ncbi:hypothetical protein GQ43DRAFT_17282 [Delitschia confertaspora ATCC 74209]|uniref:Uncharacterized protein n=1 Tax=Delitschia confertaspora ATCC 74209 TaxID=1513339 RepID=A0A9P4MTB3_9PLEO|nr:hypothetical protein GQ43DRAFT_17282 [Delitschia confertaspora ATCC 74209]
MLPAAKFRRLGHPTPPGLTITTRALCLAGLSPSVLLKLGACSSVFLQRRSFSHNLIASSLLQLLLFHPLIYSFVRLLAAQNSTARTSSCCERPIKPRPTLNPLSGYYRRRCLQNPPFRPDTRLNTTIHILIFEAFASFRFHQTIHELIPSYFRQSRC